MRRQSKSFLTAFVILIVVLVVAFSFSSTTNTNTHANPPDFYSVSREVSLDEMMNTADRFNLSLYIPKTMPNRLELTAIYLKNWSFTAIVVYSAEENKDYKTAELTIQITQSDSSPTYNELVSQVENSKYETVQEINSWPVLINEKAYYGGCVETANKYGEYLPLIRVWIDGMRYNINIHTITITDGLEIVRNMHSLTS